MNHIFPGILMAEICLMTGSILRLITRNDPVHRLNITKGVKETIFCFGGALSMFICFKIPDWGLWEKGAAGVLAAYLLTAALIDVQTQEVYDFLHFIGAGAGIPLFLARAPDTTLLFSVFVYWIIQRFWFARMYGMADARAFVVCSLYLGAGGGGLLVYLYHMSAAFLALGIVQALRHNISKTGNLERPVAFLPYIGLTVWIFI
jgi:hypothetical protein